jgi:hypothetical protein
MNPLLSRRDRGGIKTYLRHIFYHVEARARDLAITNCDRMMALARKASACLGFAG